MIEFTTESTTKADGRPMLIRDIQRKYKISPSVHNELRVKFLLAFIDHPEHMSSFTKRKNANKLFAATLQAWFSEHEDDDLDLDDDLDSDIDGDEDDNSIRCSNWKVAITRMTPGERYRYGQCVRQSDIKIAEIVNGEHSNNADRLRLVLDKIVNKKKTDDNPTANDDGNDDIPTTEQTVEGEERNPFNNEPSRDIDTDADVEQNLGFLPPNDVDELENIQAITVEVRNTSLADFLRSSGLTNMGEEYSPMNIMQELRDALDRAEPEHEQGQYSREIADSPVPEPTPLPYVALGFAESDLQSLPQGSYCKGTAEKNAKWLLTKSVGFGRGRVMADRMFIFRGTTASGKSSLLKAIIGLLSNSNFGFFKAGYRSLDLYEESAASKTARKLGKSTAVVTREPRWTELSCCSNPDVAWFKKISDQRRTGNNGSNPSSSRDALMMDFYIDDYCISIVDLFGSETPIEGVDMLAITSNHIGNILRDIDSLVDQIGSSSIGQTRATAANKCVMDLHKMIAKFDASPVNG
ncbi:hypothetical protein BDD12DRAFT_892418 [Trichophaea hybrida]|nr:hypothetical protein BDD12DRAFT_892418 [Trichophaea hybrida]